MAAGRHALEELARGGGRGQYRFALIGPFTAWRDGTPLDLHALGSRKGRTLLKVLLLELDQPVSRDRLVEVLWGPSPPAGAGRNLASLVSRLRGVLGADTIAATSESYRLRSGPHVDTDVREAQRLLAEARARLAGGDGPLALAAAHRGVELLEAGLLLADEPRSYWADPARGELADLDRRLRRCAWESALAVGDPDAAARLARSAIARDPLDEEACRALMEACRLRGDTAGALRAYERLRVALADELGVDPAPRTRAVHAAVLREEDPGIESGEPVGPAPPSTGRASTDFVGREQEHAALQQRWSRAAAGQPTLVLVVGEAGIGKTRLAEEFAGVAMSTGGLLMRARCHGAERSLFLAPVIEVLAEIARQVPPDRLLDLAHAWEGTLAQLVPELAAALGALPGAVSYERASPDIERRRIFEAVSSLLRRASAHQPLMVLLDDLHQAGSSTVELLHYLLRHVPGARLLIVATVRIEEGGDLERDLSDVAERLELGPLPDAAVADLTQRAGAAHLAARIVAMTRGHTLSVVETLAALAELGAAVDAPPVPTSLRAAVLGRLERAGPDVAELLRGGATLGSTFELPIAARLLEIGIQDTVRRAERALEARLLAEAGSSLAFSNDLIREIVYTSTPQATRAMRHARAAELLAGNPEAVAYHRTAAGDWSGALAAWLEAAEQASARFANRDAERLLDQAVDAAERAGDDIGLARARLARARVRETLADYEGEFSDLEVAAGLARSMGGAELEARALRELGGDVLVGLGRPATDCLPYLEAGLHVARTARLGELEVELMGRMAVIWTNRARFDRAAEVAEQALDRARELDDERSLALALDAMKNVSAYLGDLPGLERVLAELKGRTGPLDRRWLPWVVFESVMPHLARAEWVAAAEVLDQALELNERLGSAPWASLFVAHRSWLHRARGEYGAALVHARAAAATERTGGHPWWSAFADAMLGWVLSDAGAQTEAVDRLEQGVADAERDGMETYLVRCTSHLALARWRLGDRSEAQRLLERGVALVAGVTVPPGRAFLHGAHAYMTLARLWLGLGETDAAEQLLDAVRAPAASTGWRELVTTDHLLRGCARLLAGDPEQARALLEEAVRLAEGAHLRPLAWEARAGLARAHRRLGDGAAAAAHERAATAHLEAITASIDDVDLRRRTTAFARRRQQVDSLEPPG